MTSKATLVIALYILAETFLVTHAQAEEPSYIRDVQPILRKYCGGCHNEAEREADFSVATFDSLSRGTPDGKVIEPGTIEQSRLLKLIAGQAEPKMPPDGEAQPTEAEVARLRQWIAAGAKNDARSVPLTEQLMAPKLAADPAAAKYISSMIDVSESLVAIARGGQCELRDWSTQEVVMQLEEMPGKINQMRLSPDRKYLLVAGGIAGIGGQVTIVDVQQRAMVGRIQGHTDAIYCAVVSPDNQWLCTGSYDRQVILWNWREQSEVRRFTGHNGAIYDLDIDTQSIMLATASADQTVKLWGLKDGMRLDTLGQGEGEMLCVRFSPDGNSVIASGADRQLRLWKILDKTKPTINPLRISRFAHEEPVTQIVVRNHAQLLTLAEDKTVKLWSLPELTLLGVVSQGSDVPTGVGKLNAKDDQLLVADFAGSLTSASLPALSQPTENPTAAQVRPTPVASVDLPMPTDAMAEKEPNNNASEAQPIKLPTKVTGLIASEADGSSDFDCFAIETQAGIPWVIEVKAAQDKSPLDSLVEVLDKDGQPVLRTRLQAIRESYFTFRGKDSTTIDDYRMHKWQEMELNQLLYAGGEVVKLWLYPRGPDSGFKVYPGYGTRITYFDTTPTAHALGEVAYIVKELAPGEVPQPNGLPIFPVYYQNDDDGTRRTGKDSRLTFVAPSDGQYIIRLRDARGFSGQDFKYQLTVRPQVPDFEIELRGADLTLPPGSGREWQVVAKRLDDLTAPIEVQVTDIPAGLEVTNPLVIESEQDIAYGNVYALPDFKLPEGQDKVTLKLRAVSRVDGKEIVHELSKSLTIKLKEEPEVRIKLADIQDSSRELTELTIRPGQTISAQVLIDRQNQAGPIALGKEDAGRNLPHGSFVDNIGLNGLLITEGNSQREFFITAAPWLPPQEREFHLRSESKNNPTSRSIRLRVLPGE